MTIFKLNQMARLGDTAAVRVLLNSGITVDARDEQQYTPLMHAAGSLRAGIDMLQLLVQAGADVNATARSEVSLEEQTHVLVRSVIREALAGGQVEKIEYLLDTGADLHYTDPHGYEAMLHLVHGRDIRQDADLLPAARLLLSRGAAPNPVSTYGESPLRQAVSVGRFDLVQLLLEAGVTPQVSGWTDVVLVLLFDTMAALRPHLRVGADLDTADQLGLTPFHLAVLLGNVEKAALLVEAGADWTRPTDRGQSAAGLAIEAGRPEMLAWLLSRGGRPGSARWSVPAKSGADRHYQPVPRLSGGSAGSWRKPAAGKRLWSESDRRHARPGLRPPSTGGRRGPPGRSPRDAPRVSWP